MLETKYRGILREHTEVFTVYRHNSQHLYKNNTVIYIVDKEIDIK